MRINRALERWKVQALENLSPAARKCLQSLRQHGPTRGEASYNLQPKATIMDASLLLLLFICL